MIDPFHLVSTPVALLPQLNLRTRVGLSGEDPAGRRHQGVGFGVWLTVYSPTGERLERRKVMDLPAGARRFLDLTAQTERFGFSAPHVCVVHRIPDGVPEAPFEPHPGFDGDFDMFRTLVQYESAAGGRGGVIYETPPHFNARPGRGSFLSFTNQVVRGAGMKTVAVTVHYSVNPDYAETARRRLLLYRPDGALARVDDGTVAPNAAEAVDFDGLLEPARRLEQYGLVVCSGNASMIPLLVNLHEGGGVSVEHTHPPMAYLGLPPAQSAKIRAAAIERYLKVPEHACARS